MDSNYSTPATSTNETHPARLIMLLAIGLACLFTIFNIGRSIYISRTTGLLVVKSPTSEADLTLGRDGYSSVEIGSGNVRVRLEPGIYRLAASRERSQIIQEVRIAKGEATIQTLPSIPSTQEINANKKAGEANTLIKLLPYTGPSASYKIDYEYTITSTAAIPTIVITSPTQQGQQDAQKWIEELKFNLSNLDIKYITGPVEQP